MTGTKISIDQDTISAALNEVIDASLDLTPALMNIGEHMVASSRERIMSGTDPQGVPWPALNPRYEFGDNEKPGKKGKGMLRETDALFNSIAWSLFGDDTVEFGSAQIYARIHNEGGTIRPKSAHALVFELGALTIFADSVTIPQRQYLGFSDEDALEIQHIILDHFRPNVATA